MNTKASPSASAAFYSPLFIVLGLREREKKRTVGNNRKLARVGSDYKAGARVTLGQSLVHSQGEQLSPTRSRIIRSCSSTSREGGYVTLAIKVTLYLVIHFSPRASRSRSLKVVLVLVVVVVVLVVLVVLETLCKTFSNSNSSNSYFASSSFQMAQLSRRLVLALST